MKAKIKGVYVNIPEGNGEDINNDRTYQKQWNIHRRRMERKFVHGRRNFMGMKYYDYLTMDSGVIDLLRDKILNSGVDIDIIGNEIGYDGFTVLNFLLFKDYKKSKFSHAAFMRLLEICGYHLEIKVESSGSDELHKYLHDERLHEMISHEKNKKLLKDIE